MNIRHALLIVVAVAAGCAGGTTGGTFPPASVSTPASPGTAGPSSSSRGTVSLHVVIPAGSGTSAHRRRPQFVSPATQSLAFSWPSITNQYGTSPSGSVIVPLTASSPGCSTENGDRTCAVMIPVPAGFGVQFSVVTYEGSNGTGTALGYGTSLPIDILPGTTSNLSVTVAGVLGSLSLNEVPYTYSIPANQQTTLTFVTAATDPSGATIVGSGGFVSPSGNPLALGLVYRFTSYQVGSTFDDPTGVSPGQFTVGVSGPGTGELDVVLQATGGYTSTATVYITTPSPGPAPTPTPPVCPSTPPAGQIAVGPNYLLFTSAASQDVIIAEGSYAGGFTATSSDATVVKVGAQTVLGGCTSFAIDPVAAGAATIKFVDARGVPAFVLVRIVM